MIPIWFCRQCRPKRDAAAVTLAQYSVPNRRRTCAAPRLLLHYLNRRAGVMNKTNDAIWLSFEALARTYPQDDGVRLTADLARWLLEERKRLNVPVPPIIEKVVSTVTQEAAVAVAQPLPKPPVTRG